MVVQGTKTAAAAVANRSCTGRETQQVQVQVQVQSTATDDAALRAVAVPSAEPGGPARELPLRGAADADPHRRRHPVRAVAEPPAAPPQVLPRRLLHPQRQPAGRRPGQPAGALRRQRAQPQPEDRHVLRRDPGLGVLRRPARRHGPRHEPLLRAAQGRHARAGDTHREGPRPDGPVVGALRRRAGGGRRRDAAGAHLQGAVPGEAVGHQASPHEGGVRLHHARGRHAPSAGQELPVHALLLACACLSICFSLSRILELVWVSLTPFN